MKDTKSFSSWASLLGPELFSGFFACFPISKTLYSQFLTIVSRIFRSFHGNLIDPVMLVVITRNTEEAK